MSVPDSRLESGTYEIIRSRLRTQGDELRQRLERLNQARREVFGSIETEVVGTERITTDNNCVPRDMVALGNRLIFGYNVHLGLRTETRLADVFAIYDFADGKFHQRPLDPLGDERFVRDFQEVYRYYKHAVFARFFRAGPHLFMVFQVGKTAADIKTFKWLVEPELKYVDNRSDHEVRFPPQHEFEWTRTHRDLHRYGQHPHIAIDDRVFVETIGGDLTIKVENNTDTGEGIYSEPVENKDQTLDDAEIFYAVVDHLIVLKIRPYQESRFRHIVFSEKVQQARRIDAVEQACVRLPDDQGLIFPNGYYLQTGDHKTFDLPAGLLYERRLAAANGEDFLYVFHHREDGLYVLLPYNLIEQRVETPIVCNGYSLFPGGELICFKRQQEPQKHHAIQIWRTPYVDESHVPTAHTESFLYKVGNRDIVRGMAECRGLLTLLDKDDTYSGLYVDLVKASTDVLDSYFWLDRDEAANLREPVAEIRTVSAGAVEEFDKVVRVRQHTADQTRRVSGRVKELLAGVQRQRFEHVHDFVKTLAELRHVRGDAIGLRELRYADTAAIDGLERSVVEATEQLAGRTVQFLLRDDALRPYDERIAGDSARIAATAKVAEARQLEKEIAAGATELELLIEIVSNLKIDDATQRTTIIDRISGIFAKINQARSTLKARTRDLLSVEGAAEFQSQMKLLNQAVANYLDVCDAPDKCDEFLTKVMVQIEELEGRFAEFDEFLGQITEKREEIYAAFEQRKLALVEARNKRATSLLSAAERILQGAKHRLAGLTTVNDIHAYFASDLMIEKVRDLVRQLQELKDTVKADDIQSRLKTLREDAVRQLKDRQELFVGGENVIQLGRHRFSVNTQVLDLTTVLRDGRLHLHLTGTNFFEALDHAELNELADVWEQEVVSETAAVYRGEYLAHLLLGHLERANGASNEPPLDRLATLDDAELTALVQRFMTPRYAESYSKGVHDVDAGKLLRELTTMHTTLGLLRFAPASRARAVFAWRYLGTPQEKELLAARIRGYGRIARVFPDPAQQAAYIGELQAWLERVVYRPAEGAGNSSSLVRAEAGAFGWAVNEAAEYLFHELVRTDHFAPIVSRSAAELFDGFHGRLRSAAHSGHARDFEDSLAALSTDAVAALGLARDWSRAFLAERPAADADYLEELAVLLLETSFRHEAAAHARAARPAAHDFDRVRIVDGRTTRDLSGFVGAHAVIQSGTYRLDYHRFREKLFAHEQTTGPRFVRYHALKKSLVDAAREELKLDGFRPRVLTSFVRNKLIDEVYLPLVGDNLAKQIGVVGEQKRTDLMGLLLLISPPGYGKTTLMEYLANRLGLVFLKINGPAIGHGVTSLDPSEAKNAAAREELAKLNLAFEMGDNVMLCVDDIQHTHPEFLQKFISLCDAQRKIEGVYKGRTRTYDLRGRKVVVVMAGNPYTESGQLFKIPDMLANRADVYNLGEVIGDAAAAFELSYLENALTSSPSLGRLVGQSQRDIHAIIRLSEQDSANSSTSDLDGNYTAEELAEFVAVMKKLRRVRDVVLRVNREYIRSAAQSDDYRTEPPFKLQGSYRNMNRIAEKVVPIMNDRELETLILATYENDSQTLTADQESNLLKFKELLGTQTPEESQRWDDIRRTFRENVKLRGLEPGDQFSHLLAQLGNVTDGLQSIRAAVREGVSNLAAAATESPLSPAIEQLAAMSGNLASLRETLTDGLSRLEAGAGAAEPAPAAASPEGLSRVVVQHRVPKELLDVVSGQFDLLRSYLAPLLNSAQQQSEDMQRVKQTLEASMTHYAALLAELERAKATRSRSTAKPRTRE